MDFYNIAKKIVLSIYKILHKVNYYHTENIPKNSGGIVCCNHNSNWDAILIAGQIEEHLHFMAKEELFRFKPIGWILKKLYAFPVARGKGDTSAIFQAVNVINDKKFVAIFPEGTRSKNGNFSRPKPGVAMIASKTNANILPIRIIYHEPVKFRSRVDVIYGKIIPFDKLNISDNPSLSQLKSASLLIMDNIKNLNTKD